MAAYAALVCLMNDLELIPIHSRHSFAFNDKQMASLSQTVRFLIGFMESNDFYRCSRRAAQHWETQIASAAHAAHHVIESHLVNQIHARSSLCERGRGRGRGKSCFLPDLQETIDSMDFVKTKAMYFQERCGWKTYSSPPTSSEIPTTSGKNLVVGLEEVVVRLKGKLYEEPRARRVISLVGMGGMGKTTLARTVYDNLSHEHYFDVCLWATVSHDYIVENVLDQLLSGKTKFSTPNGGQQNHSKERESNIIVSDLQKKKLKRKDKVSELGEELHKLLCGRRYLVVLDNMWSVEAWEGIQNYLPDNGNGSRVIVTTRLSNLAASLSSLSSSTIEMSFLDEGKSWELFCGNAFGEEDCPAGLVEIGKRITTRCRGLPLSIVVIGGHLRMSSRATEYWEKVANSINPISSLVEDEQCLSIISLSYHHLPVYLKPCFLYMGIFQEGELIYASKLFQFWISEGFLKPNKAMSLEEVAEDYLKDLIDRNLILAHEMRWNEKVEICIVHDNVRELCLKEAKKEKFLCVLEDTSQAIVRERRVVIPAQGYHRSYHVPRALQSAPLVRSLICHGEQLACAAGHVLSSFRLLRLSAFVIEYAVDDDEYFSAGDDFVNVNLRYLAFDFHRNSSQRLLNLPSSVYLFWNLQTLVVRNYGEEITLPYETWEIHQLRHLELKGVRLPDPLPLDRSNQDERRIVLRNLHTLEGVENFRLTEEVCERIPNIKKLSLVYDCQVSSYYSLHNLSRFNKLKSLKCEFARYVNEFVSTYPWDSRDKPVYKSVIFSPNFTLPRLLEELSLLDFHLQWEYVTTMIGYTSNLGSLYLHLVQGGEWDLAEQEFTCLKILKISRCKDWSSWKAKHSNFPVLEILEISEAPELREIPLDIGEISTLTVIELKYGGVSAAVSAMRIVVEQERNGNEEIQLNVCFESKEKVDGFWKMVGQQGLESKSLHLYSLL